MQKTIKVRGETAEQEMKTTPKKRNPHICTDACESSLLQYHVHSAPSPLGRPQKIDEKQSEKYSP